MSDAVLLLAFSGPERPEEVRPFLERVVTGRRVPPARLDEVEGHYQHLGGRSPLPEWTRRQASALEARLAARGAALPVTIGYRHSAPFMEDALRALHERGVGRVVGVIMAAHDGPAARERYREAAEAARAVLGDEAPRIDYTDGFHDHPGFIEANAAHVREAMANVPRDADARLVFTAHSVPVASASPYEDQVAQSARLVAAAVGVDAYGVAYQSRSGPPTMPWLEPSIEDAIDEAAAASTRHVVVCPIGFVCDHVEVVYDLDHEASAYAEARGVTLHRAPTAGVHAAFIDALADRVLGH